jgi:hypothetical protein
VRAGFRGWLADYFGIELDGLVDAFENAQAWLSEEANKSDDVRRSRPYRESQQYVRRTSSPS